MVAPKHLELPSRYESVARSARLQGAVTVPFTISGDGDVVAAEPSSSDALLMEHPILQAKTGELMRRRQALDSPLSRQLQDRACQTTVGKSEFVENREVVCFYDRNQVTW